MEPRLYSIAELSPILKLHPKTLVRFIHEGKIKARKIGRSWMVNEDALREYAHGEFAGEEEPGLEPDYSSISERITVSTVIEVIEQNSEEASRISNSLLAMLNSKDESWGKSRFDFFYYPEARKAKYIFFGSSKFIMEILRSFDMLCRQKEE